MPLEDGEKAGDDAGRTAIGHAWDWWKYHAEQRIALLRLYIVSLGGVAAGVGLLYQNHERLLCAVLSVFGATLAYAFLRLGARTSDLVKIGENALAHEQAKMASITQNEAIQLCEAAERNRQRWPYSYGEIVRFILRSVIIMFAVMILVAVFR